MKLQKSFAVAVLLMAITGWNLTAGDASPSDFSKKQTFMGTATPLITCNLLSGFNDDWRGMIYHTALPGTIFKGSVKDKDGKLIKEGTVLFEIDKVGRQILLDQFIANLRVTEQNYERSKKLLPGKSISRQQYDTDESAYYAAIAQVKQQKYLVDLCTIRAPFDGIVNTVLNVGWLSGEPPVMQVSMLSPMGISIEMDRALANKITPSTPIAVYPDPSINKDVFGILRGHFLLTDKGITFIVYNYEATINGENVPVVNSIHPVIHFDREDKDSLSVCVDSVYYDDKGSYVWQAVGQKDLSVKGLDKVFALKKIYVELTDKSKVAVASVDYVGIKATGLSRLDITVENVPEGFKDGDKVAFMKQRFVFMPGDQVKVEIGPTP